MYRARKKVKVRPTNQTRCWNDFTHYSHPLDNWRSVHAHGNANQVRVTVEACYQKRVPIVIDKVFCGVFGILAYLIPPSI